MIHTPIYHSVLKLKVQKIFIIIVGVLQRYLKSEEKMCFKNVNK